MAAQGLFNLTFILLCSLLLQNVGACPSDDSIERHCSSAFEDSVASFQCGGGNITKQDAYKFRSKQVGNATVQAGLGGELIDDQEHPISPIYEIRPSSKKGLGVFALRSILTGIPIITEAPLLTVPLPVLTPGQGFRLTDLSTSLETAYLSLSPTSQNLFLSLHNHRFPDETESDLVTIFRSNAYNTGDDDIGLFPEMARVNHGCTPNAGNWWSEARGVRIIYAMRDIAAGEEVTVSYIPLLKSTEERRARLAQYGFECQCEACQDVTGGDKRRARIADRLEDLEGKVGRRSVKADVRKKRAVKAVDLVGMVEKEELWDYLARAYHLAAIFSEQHGQMNDAQMWARRELEMLSLPEADSKESEAVKEIIDRLAD